MESFRRIAVSLASTAISLAALGAGAAKLLESTQAGTVEFRAVVSLAALFLIFASAICLDWIQDSAQPNEIRELSEVFHDSKLLRSWLLSSDWMGVKSRMVMYCGGYLMITLAYAAFAYLLGKSAIILAMTDIFSIKLLTEVHMIGARVTGLFFAVAIFFKMMTQTLSPVVILPFITSAASVVLTLLAVVAT